MAKANKNVNDIPSFETGMLSYARSIQVTEGLFFATKQNSPESRTPVQVLEKGVRGQTSQDKAKDKAGKSNPQSVEYAVLPQGHDGVELSFSIRFMPLSLKPNACGNSAVGDTHTRFASRYKSAGGFEVLAKLYLWNIANARFAWRNRYQSDEMTVSVEFAGVTLKFDPMQLDLELPADENALESALVAGTSAELTALINGIVEGLSNETSKAFSIKVRWNAEMQPAQEIFPSQEYVRDENKDDKLSRVYAKLPVYYSNSEVLQASMHSQKIGAALRHIDIWHGSETHRGAIAVNPYGGVQETSEVLRAPATKKSFYDIRAKATDVLVDIENAKNAADISPNAHFLMANLVRGGVFGSSSKKAEANG